MIKATDNLTFEINYHDGIRKKVETGILISMDDKDKIAIHIGTCEAWHLFAFIMEMNNFIDDKGLRPAFEKYKKYVEAYNRGGKNEL